MTGKIYLYKTLRQYRVSTNAYGSTRRNYFLAVRAIRDWANKWLVCTKRSGSFAKGTAVSTGSDVDLFISLKSRTPGTLREIYQSLYSRAAEEGWLPRRQNVSIGIKINDTSIDLIPARVQLGRINYHSLYRSKIDSWTQTNIDRHIYVVSNCNRKNEIKLMKIWRELHGLDFPSFYIELFVIDALRGRKIGDIENNVQFLLEQIASSLDKRRLVDPANTNNIVSEDLTEYEKGLIMAQADRDAKEDSWGAVFW